MAKNNCFQGLEEDEVPIERVSPRVHCIYRIGRNAHRLFLVIINGVKNTGKNLPSLRQVYTMEQLLLSIIRSILLRFLRMHLPLLSFSFSLSLSLSLLLLFRSVEHRRCCCCCCCCYCFWTGYFLPPAIILHPPPPPPRLLFSRARPSSSLHSFVRVISFLLKGLARASVSLFRERRRLCLLDALVAFLPSPSIPLLLPPLLISTAG